MTALTATAIITAVDRASAVFARVGANARALGGRFAAATGGLTRFGSAAAMNLGLPAAMVGGMAARGEYEIDKLARVMQAAGELSNEQREMLTDKAFEVSAATGQSAADILRGQRELILGGLDADTAAATSDIIAKVSRANEIAAGQVAEDAITNASALGLAMGTTEEKVASLTKTLDFMSTVPAFSPMNWQDLSTSMKYAGPVAGALKIQMKDLGAALSMLAFAGFKGEEAGTALRTILTRLVAPTRKARVELAAAGIDQTKLFKIDAAKANDKAAMLDGLVQQGLMTEKERARAEKILSSKKLQFDGTNAGQYTERVNAVLQRILGIGKGDTQEREILKAAIDNHMLRAVGDLDMEQVFTAIKDLPLKSLKEMFGLQRLSQARALVNKINEIVKLPNGERISAWKKLREEIGGAIDGASDRKAEPVMTGFAATMDRVGASLANMRHQIFEAGLGSDLASVFEGLSRSVNDLARTDPDKLRQIGWALTGLMVAPAAGFAVSGLAALGGGLTSLATGLVNLGSAFAKTPLLNKLLIGGGLAGLFLGLDNIGSIFGQAETASNGAILSRKVSPLLELFQSMTGVAGEAMGLVGDIFGKVQNAVGAMKEFMGLDPSTSVVGMGLSFVAERLREIQSLLKGMRSLIAGEGKAFEGAQKSLDTIKSGVSDKGVLGWLLEPYHQARERASLTPEPVPDVLPSLRLLNLHRSGMPAPAPPVPDVLPPLRLLNLHRSGMPAPAAPQMPGALPPLRLLDLQRDIGPRNVPAAAPPLPLIRDQYPEAGMQRVDVKGEAKVGVTGNVTGTMTLDATIRVEGGGQVTQQKTGGGAVSGKLDPGESNMDLSGP